MTNKLTEIDSKFYQEYGIIMLPAKEKTNIVKQLDVKTNHLQFVSNSWVSTYNWEYQHLYFISNEEIKKGDWVLRGNGSYGCRKVLRIHKDFAICTDFWDKPIETSFPLNELKKIIATTDRELTIGINQCDGCQAGLPLKDGIHKDHQVMGIACTKERYIKQLPRPSNEFLKKFCELGGIDKVLVEMYDDGEEDWMGDDYNGQPFWNSHYILKIAPDNTITCKPVQEEKKTWNKAEVEVLCRNAFMRKDVGKGLPFDYTDTSCDKWIKENLK